ncbi:MAG: 5-carboxymethyl-2-hydroxymuconate Delta-isomerase [Pararhodobacter sp.]
MPHLSIEYSANLEGRVDMDALCRGLLEAVLETGLFELGAVRVRAFAATHSAIADQHPENAFVDMSLRIGRGRSSEECERAGALVFARAEALLSQPLKAPHFALTLEIREIDSALSWKRNAIHPRLRGARKEHGHG